MKHIAPSELSDSSLAELGRLITIAGGHHWSLEAIEAYMDAEAKKLRPNWLYYFATALFFTRQSKLNHRIDVACLLGMAAGLLSFLAGFAMIAVALNKKDASFGIYGILAVASGVGLFTLGWRYFFATEGYKILGYGYWKTVALDDKTRHHTYPVSAQFRTLQAMMPQGTRYEISLLYQEKWIFDPVLWIVQEVEDVTVRTPFIVWDQYGKVVLPQ